MLGKLLKYDLKWIYKAVIVFYILAFIFSVIGRGLSLIEDSLVFSIFSKISFGIAISMMASALINCLMRSWARFIRNIYKDESYLTHTLPVEEKTIFASKVLAAIICTFTTIIVIMVCLFICYYSQANIEVLKTVLELAASTYNTTVINLLVLVFAVLFLQAIFIILIGYTGIIFGYKSNQNKLVKSVVIGFGLYSIMQVVSVGLIAIFGVFNPEIMNLLNTTGAIDVEAIKVLMHGAIGIYIVYIAFYYVLAKKQLEKGVNVD